MMASSGITLAVIPIHILVEHGGLLDTLQDGRVHISGPNWKHGT